MQKSLSFLLVSIVILFAKDCVYAQSVSPLPPGDGIYNYSVATDVFYGTKSTPATPSLAYDIKTYGITKIKYIFPDFINIISPTDGQGNVQPFTLPLKVGPQQSSGVNPSCPTKYTDWDVWYFAIPIVKPSEYINSDPGVLGNCINGYSVTSYYKNLPGSPGVIPNLEWNDGNFPAALAKTVQNNPNATSEIANSIADLINNDPNALGLAIDNEGPAINKISASLEQNFFSALANRLATKGKYLFLFDALQTAQTLYNGGNGINNIIVLRPLYDDGYGIVANQNPIIFNNYLNYYSDIVTKYLGNSINPPVMFVLPASATDEEWDYVAEYLNTNKTAFQAQPPSSVTLNSPSNCSVFSQDPVSQAVIKALLNSNEQSTFLTSSNCNNFNNSLQNSSKQTAMQTYFQLAMTAVSNGLVQNKTNNKFIGVALYAWHIPGNGAISGAVDYASNLGIHKRTLQNEPQDISKANWIYYQNQAPWKPLSHRR